MFDSFSNTMGAFNFNEIFEGNIIEVYDNNTCLIYLPKFFLKTDEESKKIEGKYLIDNDKILNHVEGKKTLTATNGIICKPLMFNSFSSKVKAGENVLVFFFNGDPQKPYYINTQLGKKMIELTKDTIFEDANKEIGIYSENNEKDSRVIIKVKDKEYIFSDKNSFISFNPNEDSNSLTNNTTSVPSKYTLEKEWKIIQSERKELEEVCAYYKLIDSFESYDKIFIELKNCIEPLIENIDKITNSNYEKYNEKFINYYKAYNSLLKNILKANTNNNESTINPVDVSVIESIIKDLLYKNSSSEAGQFIKDIIKDNIFSAEEKILITKELAKIFEEKRVMDTFAPMYYSEENEIRSSHDEFNMSYTKLRNYLDPMLANLNEDTEINQEEAYTKFNDYFNMRLILIKDIQSYSKTFYESIEKGLLEISKDLELSVEDKELLKNKFDSINKEKILIESLSNIYDVSMLLLDKCYTDLEELLYAKSKGYLISMDTSSVISSKVNYENTIKYYINERNKQLDRIIATSASYISNFMEGTNIGSANLVLNSTFKLELKKWSFPSNMEGVDIIGVYSDEIDTFYLHSNAQNIYGTLSKDIYKAKKGEDMVLSLWTRSEKEMSFTVEILDSLLKPVTIPYVTKITPGKEFSKVVIPIEILKELDKSNLKQNPIICFKPLGYIENSLNKNIIFDLSQIKLEFGNIPSTWSPAREDYEEQIENVIEDLNNIIDKTEEMNSTLEDKADSSTVDKLDGKVTELNLYADKINIGAEENRQNLDNLIKVTAMKCVNNFSVTGNLNKWSSKWSGLNSNNNTAFSQLEKNEQKNHAIKIKAKNATIQYTSEIFPVDPTKDFRINLQVLFDNTISNEKGTGKVTNGDGIFTIRINSYSKEKELIGTYKNDGTELENNRALIISKANSRYNNWTNISGFVYGCNTQLKFENIEDKEGNNPFIIKGNCDNALKLKDTNVAYLSYHFEFQGLKSDSVIYFAYPEVYQIDEMTNEQYQLLRKAYIQITPGKIEEKIFTSNTYTKDMGDRYTKEELEIEITKEHSSINEVLTRKFLSNEIAGENYLSKAEYLRDNDKWRSTFSSSGGYNMLFNSSAKNDMKVMTGEKGSFIEGIPHWYDNGGGCEIDRNGQNVALYGYRFKTNPSKGGTMYSNSLLEQKTFDGIQLKNDTDYVFSANFWYHEEFNIENSFSNMPLHFWCSESSTTNGIDQCEIIDWDQSYRNLTEEEKNVLIEQKLPIPSDVFIAGKRLYIHFRTKSTGDVIFTPFIYTNSTDFINGDLYFNQVMLCEAKTVVPWSPHPDESYNATVRMDENGLLISHSNEGTSTVMNQAGFFIKNNNGDVIGELASKTGLTVLSANKVYANNMVTLYEGPSTVYVNYDYTESTEEGTASKPYKTISNAIKNMFTNNMSTILPHSVTIDVKGTSYSANRPGDGSFCLYNLTGVGTLSINIHSDAYLKFSKQYDEIIGEYEGICLQSCTVGIHIRGSRKSYDTNDGAMFDASGNELKSSIRIGGCSYVSLEKFRMKGNNEGLNHIRLHAGSSVHAYQIDFGKCYCCFNANDSSKLHETDCCGRASFACFYSGSGSITSDGHARDGSWRPIGEAKIMNAIHHTIGVGSAETDSIYDPTNTVPPAEPNPPQPNPQPTPPAERTDSGSWSKTDYGYYAHTKYYNWNPGGKKIMQSNWGYGNNCGYACFSNTLSWTSGSKRIASGSTITIGRPNEAGNSASTPVYLGASSISSCGGDSPKDNVCSARVIGYLAWGETKTFTLPDDIAEALRNGSARSLCFWSSSGSSSHYAKFNVGTLTLNVVRNA